MRLLLGIIASLVLSLTLKAHADPRLRDRVSLDVVQTAIDRALSMETPPVNCSLPAVSPLPLASMGKRARHIVDDQNGKPNPLTVFTEKEADEIQTYIAAQDHLAHDFIEAGCWQRAIEINRLLISQGFQTGIIQAFADFRGEGEGFRVDSPPANPDTVWKMHTAALIAVRVKGKVELRVIDYALSKKSISKDKWLAELKRRRTNDDKVHWNLMALDQEMTDVNIRRANQTLRIYRDALLKR